MKAKKIPFTITNTNKCIKQAYKDGYKQCFSRYHKMAEENEQLKAQIEKMKRCFNCSKWFSNTELCVSNERGTSICDKWEIAE